MSRTFEKKYAQLMSNYEETKNPEILEAIYKLVDKQVYDEKTIYHIKHIALSRLEELERKVKLSPILEYRKAVLLRLSKREDEALLLFEKLIQSEEVDQFIKDRSIGYILQYYDDVIKLSEAVNLLKVLKETTDPTALHMLETIEMLGKYDEPQADEEPDDRTVVFTSEDRVERSFEKRITESSFRIHHTPSGYDLFLDQAQLKYYIHGKEMDLTEKEIGLLFTMAKLGQRCGIVDLYPVVYREEYKYTKQQKDKFQKFTSRFRRGKLKEYGFDFENTNLHSDTTFCLIYKESFEENLTDYLMLDD